MFSGPITKPGISDIQSVPRRHSSHAMWRHNSPFRLHSVQVRNAGKENVSDTRQSLMKWKVHEESKTKMSGNKLVGPWKLFAIFWCLASGKKWLQPNKTF